MSLADLEAKYPLIFTQGQPRGGPGWSALLEVLCARLQARADESGLQPVALQAREKWGYLSLRFHRLDPADAAMVRTYSFNLEAIASLRLEFEIYAIRDEARIINAFSDAMRDARATWLWHKLPRPYTNARAILLPRSEGNSMRVAHSLCEAGVLDLGTHWTALALRPLGK